MKIRLKTTDDFSRLQLGDIIYLSGDMLTLRDMAHRRVQLLLKEKKKIPFSLKDAVVFHAGPIVKKAGKGHRLVAIGSTTSRRMSKYMKMMNRIGVKGIIGKGGMGNTGSITYFSYAGGCAALGAKMLKIKKVGWLDLGIPEAVWHLKATDFGPLIVAIKGKKSLYKSF